MKALRWILPVAILTLPAIAAFGETPSSAGNILQASGVKTGFCLLVACDDGGLAADLAEKGGLLVQAVTTDEAAAYKARQVAAARGRYGQATVVVGRLDVLAYVDDLADLVVVPDAPAAIKAGLSLKEVIRVASPGGVVLLGDPGNKAGALRAQLSAAAGGPAEPSASPRWAKLVKPRPKEMDEWTHRAHDAGGSAVSEDTSFGPLTGLRWVAGPAWPMGPGYQESNGGIFASGGRMFNVTLNTLDNYPVVPQTRDRQYYLTARDAFNGLLLWSIPIKRPIARDGQSLAIGVVVTPDRVYTALGSKLLALDAATGQPVQTYLDGNLATLQLALEGGTLLAARRDDIIAFDVASGDQKWKHDDKVQSMLVGAGQVFYATRGFGQLISLDLASGRQKWRADLSAFKGAKPQLLFCKYGIVAFVWRRSNKNESDNAIAAFDVRNGKCLWNFYYPSPSAHWPDGVHPVTDLVWIRKKNGWHGLYPMTGELSRQMRPRGGYCGGCMRNIATEEFLVSTRPPNVFDWDDGQGHNFRGGRHPCRSGVIVANGLLYSQPHGCKCVHEALHGFIAFGPQCGPTGAATGSRLVQGPAAGAKLVDDPPASSIWPTFRGAANRSAATAGAVGAAVKPLWQVQVDDQKPPEGALGEDWLANPLGGDRITAATIGYGKVFVCLPDANRLVALDADDGKTRWAFTAAGRLDTPPTLYKGLCLLGSYDGSVYCLRADDGRLVWRFQAAPEDRRILANGQMESAWPILGGVLVGNDTACFTAGRSSAVDGGVYGYGLDPATGKVLWSHKMPIANNDVLVRDGNAFRLAGGASAGRYFDFKTGKQTRNQGRGGHRWDFEKKIHTLWGGPSRVMDRSWHVLSHVETAGWWMRIQQGYGPNQGLLAIGSCDLSTTYGYGSTYVHWSKAKDPKQEFNGQLIAMEGAKRLWKAPVPKEFQAEAMALAGDVLFAAGPNDRFRRQPGGTLKAISAADGSVLAEYPLEAGPAADGLAAVEGMLVLTTTDGRVICYGPK